MKKALALVSLCAVSVWADVDQNVQNDDPVLLPLTNLVWHCGPNARIENGILTVDVPPEKAKYGGSAWADIDLAPYCGRGVKMTVRARGERIAKPGNYIVRVGTSVKEIIDYCGGFTGDDVTVKMGGPMMGILLPDVNVSVIKGTNGIIAIETDETEAVACIKCGRCADVCPMELSPLYFQKFVDEENWQGLKDRNIMDCIECRSCEYICSSKIPLLTKIKAGKAAVRGMK